MKAYEVRLSREATHRVHTTVSVQAATEEDAKRLAISHVKSHQTEWSGGFTDPPRYGEIEVEKIEEIVDFEESL
jgi:hypothetical protein